MKKLISLLVIICILLSFTGCGEAAPAETTAAAEPVAATLSAEDQAILAERRDIAESYGLTYENILNRVQNKS